MIHEKGLPYEVTVAETLAEARVRLAEIPFDVVVADFHLPDGDCTELFDEVKDTPFILLTATMEENLALRTLERGADDYLPKDIEHHHLSALPFTVEKTLHRRHIREKERRLTQEIRESEQRLRAMFEKAVVGIIEMDAAGRCIAANDHLCEILGYSREDLLKKTVRDLTVPEDRPISEEYHQALHQGLRDSVQYDKRYVKGDGALVWVHVTISAIRNPQGRYLYSIGTVEDISDRKRYEERIRQLNLDLQQRNAELAVERERWQGVVEGIADEVWVCDVQGRTRLMNSSSLSLKELKENRDQSIEEVLEEVEILNADGTPRPKRNEPLLKSLRGEILCGEEIMRHRRSGKTRYRQFSSAPTRDAAGAITGAVAVVRDITELKRLEQELKEAKDSAEQASRAKDHFLAVLSHELRTPLTPVVMALSMLGDRRDLAAGVRETLDMVRRNLDLEARLIDDLLDITRIARGKIELQKQRVKLGSIVSRAVEVCRSDIETRQLHFGVDLAAIEACWIEADSPRLEQVFWNLLKNAIKFTPHGGCVGVRCRPLAGEVAIDVSDSGVGIEPEALSRIFNAFEQAERSITRQFGGLGLGLAISKALVEMHGGAIEAYSEGKGKGATFRVRLPLALPAQTPAEVAPLAPLQQTARPLHILLVEDHGITAKIMQMMLAAEGHTVERAGDVATALKLVEQESFELLISDLGLPDASGHDLMRQLRQRGFCFPGIALSGYGQEEDVRRSRQAGFAAHLIKPASREAVVETIASVMNGKVSPSDFPPTEPQNDAPVFDAEAALKQCFGEQDLLVRMIQYFFHDYETVLPQIHAAIERGDFHELGQLGHRLKGTLLHLGAELAEEAAADIERVGYYGGEQAEAEGAVRWLERECQVLRNALTEYQNTLLITQA
jgi:two-component system CheB/CheR fusion protein